MGDIATITFDFWSVLLAFGIFQGLLMVIILLGFKQNLALYSLIGLVLVLVLNLFNQLLLSANLTSVLPHLVYVSTPFLYLMGPLYQWHAKSALDPTYKPQKVFLHLIPFIIGILLLMPFYSLDTVQKVQILETQQQSTLIPVSLSTFVLIASHIILTFVYIYNTSWSLAKARKSSDSKRERHGNKWFRKFGFIFAIYWFVDFTALVVYAYLGAIHAEVFYITMLGATLFINVLVVFILKNYEEFSLLILKPWIVKYKNSQLTNEDTAIALDQIFKLMEEQKPYLDPELSLAKFASLLNKTPHQISQILNSGIGKSFYEFINEYRFEEAKKRLEGDQYNHLTILAIALDSGFNNKNTFNKVFKKYTGKTPSQFLKEA